MITYRLDHVETGATLVSDGEGLALTQPGLLGAKYATWDLESVGKKVYRFRPIKGKLYLTAECFAPFGSDEETWFSMLDAHKGKGSVTRSHWTLDQEFSAHSKSITTRLFSTWAEGRALTVDDVYLPAMVTARTMPLKLEHIGGDTKRFLWRLSARRPKKEYPDAWLEMPRA